MSMTHEEAARILDPETSARALSEYGDGSAQIAACDEACRIAADVLRNKPTGEALTIEQLRGEWIIEDAGNGDRRKKCSLCDTPISGWWGRDRFCANCGAPMTAEAVQMVMERLEALKDGKGD